MPAKIVGIRIDGRRTSVRLESTEHAALRAICAREKLSINEFCERADHDPRRQESSRSGRIRMAILEYYLGLDAGTEA